MTQLLSSLSITGFGTYQDFWPAPISRGPAFAASAFTSTAFRTQRYQEETTLTEGAETKLLAPLVFARTLTDDGSPSINKFTAELSNVNIEKIPAPRQLLGVAATGTLHDVEAATEIERLSGIITEIQCAPERMTLTIEQDASAPLQALIPKRLVKDYFPSADFSGLSINGDPSVIIPWGIMYKVPLPLCQRPYLHCEYQMQANSPESFYYLDLQHVPDYVVQTGDVFEYDMQHFLPGTQIAMDLVTSDGTILHESGAVDQNGFSCHPATNLDSVAVGRWYRRSIPLTSLVGKTITLFLVGCHRNVTGGAIAYFATARIVDAFGDVRITVFDELTNPDPVPAFNVPGTNAASFVKREWWDYGPIRQPASGELHIHSVYRGSAAIAPSEYTLVEALPDIMTLRFTAPQRDTNGQPAGISITLSSNEFQYNAARVTQFLLSNATDGCGVAVDAAAFGSAAATLTDAQMLVVGGLSTQRPAIDVIRDLSFHGAQLGVNDAGAYTATADSASLHALNAVEIGEGDGEWENVSFAPASFRLLDQLKQLTIKAMEVQDFGGSTSYAVTASRSQVVNGSTVTEESPYLSPKSVDREVYYRFTRNAAASLYRAEVTAKSMELRTITVNDRVVIHCPNDPDLDTRALLVTARTLTAGRIMLSLRGYDPATYTYVGMPVQMTGIPPLIDYRFTLPDTPTNFAAPSAVTAVTGDGSIKTFVTVTADAPTRNVTDLRFRAIPVGSVLFTEIPVAVTLGQTTVTAVFALEPGLTYHYEVYAYNGGNQAEFRFSVPAQLLNQTVPGDTAAPAAASAVQVRQSGTKTVEIEATFTPPADWGTTYLYRNTVDNSASAVVIETGKKKLFHDQNISYNNTYYYWVKVADTSGNLSGFSPSSGHSILIRRLLTDDYDDGSVTNVKVGNLSAAKITTGLLTVNPVTSGATAVFVDNAGAIRFKAMVGVPSRLSFEDSAGIEKAWIAGDSLGNMIIFINGPFLFIQSNQTFFGGAIEAAEYRGPRLGSGAVSGTEDGYIEFTDAVSNLTYKIQLYS